MRRGGRIEGKKNEQRPFLFFLIKISYAGSAIWRQACHPPPHLSLPLEKKHVRVLLILKEAPTLEKLLEPPVNSTALYLQARPGWFLSAFALVPSAACTKLWILFQEFICSNFVSYPRSRPSAELQLVALRILEETHFRGKCLLPGSANWAHS